MIRPFDILGLGVTAVDDLLYVPEYPPPDSKVRIRWRERQCGGLTATALVAAARLGSKCAFAGILGDDELCRFVLQRLEEEGVDTAHVRRRPEAGPAYAAIVVDESRGTRNIFCDVQRVCGPEPDRLNEELIRSAKVLFVDHFGIDGMIRAAQVARSAGAGVVADFENDEHPRFLELVALVDHLILSQAFAARLSGQDDPAASVEALWSSDRGAVVVTCGAHGCWYIGSEHGGRPRHEPASCSRRPQLR